MNTRKFTILLASLYAIALVWILLLKLGVTFSYMDNRSVNLIPFREFLRSDGHRLSGETILNVLIFLPAGVYACLLLPAWSFAKKCALFFCISTFIEAVQYILAIGAFDVTDIITNTSGALFGLLCYHALSRLFSNRASAYRFFNILGAAGTLLLVVGLSLLKLGLLPIRYQ